MISKNTQNSISKVVLQGVVQKATIKFYRPSSK